jgi:hypothetical protein
MFLADDAGMLSMQSTLVPGSTAVQALIMILKLNLKKRQPDAAISLRRYCLAASQQWNKICSLSLGPLHNIAWLSAVLYAAITLEFVMTLLDVTQAWTACEKVMGCACWS